MLSLVTCSQHFQSTILPVDDQNNLLKKIKAKEMLDNGNKHCIKTLPLVSTMLKVSNQYFMIYTGSQVTRTEKMNTIQI